MFHHIDQFLLLFVLTEISFYWEFVSAWNISFTNIFRFESLQSFLTGTNNDKTFITNKVVRLIFSWYSVLQIPRKSLELPSSPSTSCRWSLQSPPLPWHHDSNHLEKRLCLHILYHKKANEEHHCLVGEKILEARWPPRSPEWHTLFLFVLDRRVSRALFVSLQ